MNKEPSFAFQALEDKARNMEHGIRTLILLWILLSGVSGIQAQSAGDIDTLSQWRVDVSWGSPQGMFYVYSKYYISGDTLIDSQVYYKVNASGYSYWYYGGPPPYYNYFDDYHAPLREENNKWYTVNDDSYDVLLFDFTLDVGDTIDSYANQMGEIITIDSIDIIQVDGEAKQRFHLSCDFGAEYIIEDIGATTGLWESLTWFENHSILHCFAKDFVPLWINPESGSCDLSVRIDEPNKTHILSIYPNPAHSEVFISGIEDNAFMEVSIYNTIGQRVLRKSGADRRVNVSNLQQGLYVVEVVVGKQRIREKLIVQ